MDIVRVWKDAEYRRSLGIVAHPAGEVNLSDAALANVAGGARPTWVCPSKVVCQTTPTTTTTTTAQTAKSVCVCP
ncbi:mersacidin/lichenicidin family type 2 lantibiotic [Crossiella sp. CA-258035]|uniref:mersacidin/lichenicidin family type 2 lantibiotic n=1 Tax=Crossiella sp. CA-258035 TaxID=2981138 RepID=UPI0024BD5B78|nr:mersacidin/lichenicidin family type 2 lantibiotic [Crossiella sp. CA-258035]WHT22806.1 mersacidin/lichenicidin family type 2 lantibiotic [Crossiella sp. CA-258035]